MGGKKKKKKEKGTKLYEEVDMSINLTRVIISPCIYTSNHHVACLEYI